MAAPTLSRDAPAALGAAEVRRRPALARPLRRALVLLFLVVVPVVLLSSLIVFTLGHLSPVDPAAARLGENATAADVARLHRLWGLDQPFAQQYLSWLGHALTGDLGRSYLTDIPVADAIAQRLPVDLSVALVALVAAVLIGFPAGIAAGVRPGGRVDKAVTALGSLAVTVPVFLVGIWLVQLFAVHLTWLPATGYAPPAAGIGEWLRHVLLPGLSLSFVVATALARQLRTSLAGALAENFVVGATLRGLSARRVLFVHVLRTAAGPAVSLIGLEVPELLGGAVVVETVFGLPGLGQYALSGAASHDTAVVQGVLLVTVGVVLVANLLVDALIGRLRPETRKG
ncbi:ABC transporter permease [Streptomyces incarnatus]|uniref:ABC transporter permease n=1 Tax=Streptomyces incarnatus TaxID=665007 RepID=A0ABN4G4R7_9ACTN|nr:ABC transporter permease [Streptomyces incarnatus]AKJ08818.1 ABC transporter permease [Streptomyces incarnatus]